MTTVAQNRYAELITVERDTVTVGTMPYECPCSGTDVGSDVEPVPNIYPYLKLQRYLFDRAKFGELTVQQMLWKRGYKASDYYTFLFSNNDLHSVNYVYDCIECNLNGPTVVAIKKGTTAYKQYVINAINRTGILKQRL